MVPAIKFLNMSSPTYLNTVSTLRGWKRVREAGRKREAVKVVSLPLPQQENGR